MLQGDTNAGGHHLWAAELAQGPGFLRALSRKAGLGWHLSYGLPVGKQWARPAAAPLPRPSADWQRRGSGPERPRPWPRTAGYASLTSLRPGVMVGAAMKTTKGANSAVLRTFSACGRSTRETQTKGQRVQLSHESARNPTAGQAWGSKFGKAVARLSAVSVTPRSPFLPRDGQQPPASNRRQARHFF